MSLLLNEEARMMLPAIEAELKSQVRRLDLPATRPFYAMLTYHMGWSGTSAAKGAGGKRVRPLLCLLACAAAGGQWRAAVPAAAAIELVHNFSLVHDDIEDNSATRRGRVTVWKQHGMPLGINAGDALFTLAHQANLDLIRCFEPEPVLIAMEILHQACLDLTKGQFLDLYHQQEQRLTIRGYWEMVKGKTAALISASTEIGALLGGASATRSKHYREFGELLGLAFQVEDDILGIWGDESSLGKSTASDLIEGKLSLPVVHGLSKEAEFARRWRDPRYRLRNAKRLRSLLEQDGSRAFAERHASRLTREAIQALHRLRPQGQAGKALEELALQLLTRKI